MKFLKPILFFVLCGVLSTLMKLLAMETNIFFSILFGLLEGGFIATAILNHDALYEWFMG